MMKIGAGWWWTTWVRCAVWRVVQPVRGNARAAASRAALVIERVAWWVVMVGSLLGWRSVKGPPRWRGADGRLGDWVLMRIGVALSWSR